MEKIYVEKVKCKDGIDNWEKLYDLGFSLRNDGREFIDGYELDKIIDRLCKEINDIELIQKLKDVNIYVDVKIGLDKSIYDCELDCFKVLM